MPIISTKWIVNYQSMMLSRLRQHCSIKYKIRLPHYFFYLRVISVFQFTADDIFSSTNMSIMFERRKEITQTMESHLFNIVDSFCTSHTCYHCHVHFSNEIYTSIISINRLTESLYVSFLFLF